MVEVLMNMLEYSEVLYIVFELIIDGKIKLIIEITWLLDRHETTALTIYLQTNMESSGEVYHGISLEKYGPR